MWQRITALGFPPLYSERTARIPQESGRCSWAGRVVCSPQIPPAMMALYPERLWGHVPSGRTGLSESQKCLFGGAGCSSKKTPFRIGGHNYIIESEGVSADRFYMVDSFIRRQADRADGLSIVQCLHIFGVSRSGYYSWVRRKKI